MRNPRLVTVICEYKREKRKKTKKKTPAILFANLTSLSFIQEITLTATN